MSIRSAFRALTTMGRGVTTGLLESEAGSNPIELFDRWFEDAKRSGILLPEAMTLATASADGAPSARMVLLKGVDADGFVFFTNYDSRKSRELTANPKAALVFHWAVLQRQIRIEGTTTRVSAVESDAYYQTRPRGSRIGAWASIQSATLSDRADLERRVIQYEQQFGTGEIPRPPHWGGFRLHPCAIEFWQGRANRLHDRLRYTRNDAAWSTTRLYP